jgi:hypothetical protein
MFAGIALKLVSWLSGINVSGVVQTAAAAYTAHVNAGTDESKINASLLAREADLAQREQELQAGLAKGEPGYVRQLFAYPVIFYYGKIFVYDKALGLGSTDPLSPELSWTARTIIVSYFGAATIISAARALRGK